MRVKEQGARASYASNKGQGISKKILPLDPYCPLTFNLTLAPKKPLGPCPLSLLIPNFMADSSQFLVKMPMANY